MTRCWSGNPDASCRSTPFSPDELHLTLTDRQPAPLPQPLGPGLDPHHPEWHRASCKGVARYLSFGDAGDVAWFYQAPLSDATQVKDMLSFWRAATVYVDGKQVPTGMLGD